MQLLLILFVCLFLFIYILEPPPPHSVALDSLFSSKPTSLMMSQHTPGEEDKDESNRRNSPPANNESETTSLPAFLDSNIPAPAAPRLATAVSLRYIQYTTCH